MLTIIETKGTARKYKKFELMNCCNELRKFTTITKDDIIRSTLKFSMFVTFAKQDGRLVLLPLYCMVLYIYGLRFIVQCEREFLFNY